MTAVRTHTTPPLPPYERGRHLGEHCGARVRAAYEAYTALWRAYEVTPDEARAVGHAVLGPVEDFAPDLRAEMAGLAAGSGLTEDQVGALNARSELLALGDQRLIAAGRLPGEGVHECTTAVWLDDGAEPVTAQTWDWHSPLADSWFVWVVRRPDGRVVRTLTEYGIVGKIGVAGRAGDGAVGVHFNALLHRADTGRGGVPVHVVARRVLDEADSLDEARRIAEAAEVSASAAVTVTAKNGDGWSAATLELHPGGPSVVPARCDRGGWLAHTNHFVAADVADDDQYEFEVSTTHERLDRACALAADPASELSTREPQRVAQALASHDLGPRSVCVHGFPEAPVGQRTETLAVVMAEPARARLAVHAGRPCEARADSWFDEAG